MDYVMGERRMDQWAARVMSHPPTQGGYRPLPISSWIGFGVLWMMLHPHEWKFVTSSDNPSSLGWVIGYVLFKLCLITCQEIIYITSRPWALILRLGTSCGSDAIWAFKIVQMQLKILSSYSRVVCLLYFCTSIVSWQPIITWYQPY